jgi:hypothetical protein
MIAAIRGGLPVAVHGARRILARRLAGGGALLGPQDIRARFTREQRHS